MATQLRSLLNSFARRLIAVGCVLILVQGLASMAFAQAPSKKAVGVPSAPPLGAKAPASTPARPAAPAKVNLPPAADSAARDQILNSAQWQETIQNFDSWLAGQTLYDAQEVKQIKARLDVGISRMNASQLQWFENDMQAKLKVLSGDQAREAEAYLSQTLAVASPTYVRKLRQKLPDVLTATASQISQQLAGFSAKHDATLQMQQAFNDNRQQNIAANQAQAAARAQTLDRDLDKESAAVKAAVKGNDFKSARDYFPNAGNDGPFGPGTSIGFFRGRILLVRDVASASEPAAGSYSPRRSPRRDNDSARAAAAAIASTRGPRQGLAYLAPLGRCSLQPPARRAGDPSIRPGSFPKAWAANPSTAIPSGRTNTARWPPAIATRIESPRTSKGRRPERGVFRCQAIRLGSDSRQWLVRRRHRYDLHSTND